MSLTATLLEAAAIRASRRFTDFEQRKGEFGALTAAIENTPGLVSQKTLDRVKTSQRRPVNISVLNKGTSTIIDERNCDFDVDPLTSAKVQLSWFTLGFSIALVPSYMEDNELSEQEVVDQGMYNGLTTVFNDLDLRTVNFLEANKQATLPTSALFGAGTGSYTGETKNFYMRAPAAMKRLMISGPYVDISNVENLATQTYLQSFGKNNQQNLADTANGQLPSAGQFQFRNTHNITPTTNFAEKHYLIPGGGLGLVQYIDSDSRNNRKVHDGKFWRTMTDDIYGLRWGVYKIADCDDFSTELGAEYTGVYGEKVRFIADFALVKPYSSDTSRPYVKFDLTLSSGS